MCEWLPCGVFCSVECGVVALGVDVEDVLAAEGVGVGVVLVGAEAPLGGPSHRVDGDAAEELHFFALNFDAVDEGFEVGGVVVAVGLGNDAAFFGSVLVVVDGVPHLPEVAAEFALLGALDLEACHGDGCTGEDGDDGHGNDELDEGEAGLRAGGRGRTRLRLVATTVATSRRWGTQGFGRERESTRVVAASDHFTCTTACEPTAGRLAWALLRAPTLTRERLESPAAVALKVRVATLPCPLTPATLGGREVEMVTRPLSSRWTMATAWPSRLRRSPASTLIS